MSDTHDDAPGYTPPAIWTWTPGHGGRFANINRPIAGPTHEQALPVGKHPLQLYSLGTPNGVKVTVMLEELLAAGHSVTVLSRKPASAQTLFQGRVQAVRSANDLPSDARFDAIVNLAGAPVVGPPWTAGRRTTSCSGWAAACSRRSTATRSGSP